MFLYHTKSAIKYCYSYKMSITAYSIKVLSSQVPYLHEPNRCKLDLIALVHLFQAKIFIKTLERLISSSRLLANEGQLFAAGHVVERVEAVDVPIGQHGDAFFVCASFAANIVVRLRLTDWASLGPSTTKIATNLDTLCGPDPAVDIDGLKFRIFFASGIVAPAACSPNAVNVG